MFDITQPVQEDNSIQRYEFHGYEPEVGTNLNSTGEIRMHITNKDTIIHPSQSYLLIEGKLTKADGTAYAADSKVTLINNALPYLFDEITYKLKNKTVKAVSHPG